MLRSLSSSFFFFNDTATTEIYTLSLHDALPISGHPRRRPGHAHPKGVRDSRSADAKRRRGREPNAPHRAGLGRRLGGARQPPRRPREPPPQQDRSRGERAAHPHDSRGRLSAGATRLSGAMRPLSFKTRLWLGHVAVLAVMLAVAAFGADWAPP